MKRKEIAEMPITNIKTFLMVWFNALAFGDKLIYNSMAYVILVQLIIVSYCIFKLV